MPILDALAGVPEDHEVLGLAAGDDEVGLAVAIEVGGLEVFDGDLLGRDHARAPSLARIVERGEQADAGVGAAPADHDLVGAGAQEVSAGDRMAILEAIEDLIALPSAGAVTGIDGRLRAVERFDRRDEVAGRQAASAEFADGLGGQLGLLPGAVGVRV